MMPEGGCPLCGLLFYLDRAMMSGEEKYFMAPGMATRAITATSSLGLISSIGVECKQSFGSC